MPVYLMGTNVAPGGGNFLQEVENGEDSNAREKGLLYRLFYEW